MNVDIMFLINHFQKIGDGFFIFHYVLDTKRSCNKHACDAKVLTPYQSENDHHVWQGNFLERLI